MWRELLKMEYLWRVPHALDGTRLAQAIGPVPATPLHAALRASLLGLPDAADALAQGGKRVTAP